MKTILSIILVIALGSPLAQAKGGHSHGKHHSSHSTGSSHGWGKKKDSY